MDNPSPPDPSMTHKEPEVKDQPTAESSTSNLSVPELSVSENSSACSSDPGAEGTPLPSCFLRIHLSPIMFPRIHLFLMPLLLPHLWRVSTPSWLHGLRFCGSTSAPSVC